MKDGLSSNQVYDLCSDHFGFLILATEQGLCKYDGREVEIIKQKSNDEFEKKRFTSLLKTKSDVIWIGSEAGLFTLNKKGEVKQISFLNKDIYIKKLLPYNDSVIISTNQGWYISHRVKINPVEFTKLNQLLKNHQITDLSMVDDRYLIGIAAEKHVIKIDLTKTKIIFETPIDIVNTTTSLSDGNIVCGAGTGFLYILNGHTGKVIRQFESIKYLNKVGIHTSINDVKELSKNMVAFTTEDDGFVILNLVTRKKSYYNQEVYNPNSLSSNQTVKILSDNNNNFFVTTLYNGVDYFNIDRYFIQKKSVFVDENKNAFKSYVNSIAVDQNQKLWLGTTDRIIEYNETNGETKYHYHHEILGNLKVKVNTLLGFKTISVDNEGKIWQGSFKGGIVVLNPKNGKEIKLTKYKNQGGVSLLPASYIWHIIQDSEGMMWAATNFGFVKINPTTYEVDTLDKHEILKKIPRKRSKYIFEDSQCRIWLGTHTNGLYRYDQGANGLVHFNESNGLAKHCYNIAEDKKGRIFVAHEKGFSIIHKNDEIENFTTANGLRNRLVEDFLFDENGDAFIANHNTIIKFNADKKQFKYFDEYFGIGQISFRSNSALKLKDGRMMWGTEMGTITFDPKKLDDQFSLPKLTIHEIFASDGRSFIAENTDNIEINIDNSIRFAFTSIDLFGAKKINYQYKLENLNNKWMDLGTENEITFSSLPKGNYIFRVRASANGIDWMEADQKIKLIVSIPIYKNPKAYFLLIFLTVTLSGIWLYQRLKSRHKDVIYKQQLADLEVRAIRAQMNPHFVFNALNSIQYFTYSGDVDRANEYLSDFAKLMRLVLQQSKDGIITLDNEIQLLSLYLKIESLRFENDFTFEVIKDQSIDDTENLSLPSMIIQPFAENAIKHGLIPLNGKKQLQIVFKIVDENLLCTIEDNGIGIDAAKKLIEDQSIKFHHQSMGMELVYKRLEMYHSSDGKSPTIEIIKKNKVNDKGTLVLISLPI